MAIAGILAREKLYIALKKVTESSSAIGGKLDASAKDLLPSEAKALVAIEQPAGIWHSNF